MSNEEIIELHNKSGFTYQECIMAVEFCKEHRYCTPMGYFKAKAFAVNTPSFTFEERVRAFSTERKEV